jgi:hypothetical protein
MNPTSRQPLPAFAAGAAVVIAIALGGWPAAAVDPRPMIAPTPGAAADSSPRDDGSGEGLDRAETDPGFVRVHVPAAAMQDVPLAAGRYVPMPLAEFDEAVNTPGFDATRPRLPVASWARYELRGQPDGSLVGSLEFEVPASAGWLPGEMPLGRVTAGRCLIRTSAGTGETVAVRRQDGGLAIRATSPGIYRCQLQVPQAAGGAALLAIPLVPALGTRLDLTLPAGGRPVPTGPTAAATVVERAANESGEWRISRGPAAAVTTLPLFIRDGSSIPPSLVVWNAVAVVGQQAEVVARVEPTAAWTPAPFELDMIGSMQVVGVSTAPSPSRQEIGWNVVAGRVTIVPPPHLIGSSQPMEIRGLGAIPPGVSTVVPSFRPAFARWAGCGTRLRVDPTAAVESIEPEQCLVVSATVGDRWPLPESTDPKPAAGIKPAVYYLEHQTPTAEASVVIADRVARPELARVTSVDISPGTVLGRAAIDIGVVSGQVFSLTADVAAGWFIDSVEPVDWTAAASPEEGGPAAAGRPLEWRVVRSRRGSELRIGLVEAATPGRPTGLRITGHRAGVPLGGEFAIAEMDMVRFQRETAMLELQVGPTAVLEATRGSLGLAPLPSRLAALAGPVTPRARLQAGSRATDLRARLVRRRPPVEADVSVDLVGREDRLAESFRFTCRPVAGELDTVIVHFSEPMEAGLEWSLITPADGSLVAQPLPPGEAAQGELRSERAVAESWLVELRPATAATVSFAATRTVPLASPLPLPLAWVEAAERPGGTIRLRGEAGRRPRLVNHRLREVPPLSDAAPDLIELSYGPPEDFRDGEAVAELRPPAATEAAGAWAWRQVTECWCHASGDIAWQATFEIQNQGRSTAMVTLPQGLQIERVLVDGQPVSAIESDAGAAGLTVPLPAVRERLTLVIEGSGHRDARFGWWSVGAIVAAIDMPVLERKASLLLPPELVPAVPLAAEPDRGWADRLFLGGSSRAAAVPERLGFRSLAVADGLARDSSLFVVRRRIVISLAIAAGCGAFLAALLLGRRSGIAGLLACAASALLALWTIAPWDTLARAVLWGCLVGSWVAGRRTAEPRALAAVVLAGLISLVSPAAIATEPEPLRVYVTDAGEGGTALVPEVLLRRLSAAQATASVRILRAELTADLDAVGWRMMLELEADRGGTLTLDRQGFGGRWQIAAEPPAGVTLTVADDSAGVRLVASMAGRYQVELAVVPARRREGGIEIFAVAVPPATDGRLTLAGGASLATAWQCDLREPGGPWLPAAPIDDCFDISGADAVRLIRPIDPEVRLMATAPAAVSFNDIDWLEDECRLTASYEVGGEGVIPRHFTLRADPALEPVAGSDTAATLSPLGGGRYLLTVNEPRPGQRRLTVGFRLPLADPVGVFDAPWAWLEDVANDVRTVRLRPAADLEASPELPPGVSLVRPRAEDGAATAAVWRNDAVAADPDESTALRPRIAVRRRVRQTRVNGTLDLAFRDDRVAMELRSRIDAGEQPLWRIPVTVPPAAVIDDVKLERLGDEPAAEERVEIVWSRPVADQVVVVVQRPEPGRYDFQLDAVLPVAAARQGKLPVARVELAPHPLEIAWRVDDEMGSLLVIANDALGDEPAEPRVVIGPDDEGPRYERSGAPPLPLPESSEEDPAVPTVTNRSFGPVTTVDLAIDGMGRAWGLARFDLIASEPQVTIRLPAGLRLFDVRVDGRDVTAEPQGGNAWQLRLHDTGWPRSLLVVFAGQVADRLAAGGPIRLEPPRLIGLPGGPVFWSLETPSSFAIRVSEPARRLDREAYLRRCKEERQGLDEALAAAVRAAPRRWRGRLAAFAASRSSGGQPEGERAWYAAWQATAAEPTRTWIEADAEGGVTIRGVAASQAFRTDRGLATAVLLGLLIAGWLAMNRFPALSRDLLSRLHRWWWIACGLLWLLVVEPAAPGWLMLAFGSWCATAEAGTGLTARQTG